MWQLLRNWWRGEQPVVCASYENVMRLVMAEHAADPMNNAALFREWADGPGKDYPSHGEMLSTSTAVAECATTVWDDGWEDDFRNWARDRQ